MNHPLATVFYRLYAESEGGERVLLGYGEYYTTVSRRAVEADLLGRYWDARLDATSCTPVFELEDPI